MIGNKTRLLHSFMDLNSKATIKSENWHVLRRDIVASSLKILCENVNPVESYGKTNMPFLY